MNTHLVSTTYRIAGIRGDLDVKWVLQELFDIFTEQGIGQATVEIAGDEQVLVVKHKPDQVPDRKVIAEAMGKAGNFQLLD
ncbi:hypothetical protein [Tessaracoccus oleiagri]|uniref:Uncharacterized protein n=1 Tax=Tessaracoccus oleiagri TaxID=686624 RepID=A0A1G9I2C5_9ACTN|nr:hypothetical protein [Tessaracoccus oleiagri]SDL19359.1 hypothetical protein SAMN04488242_0682 [Tessaracoccus oleiagri]